MVWSRARPEVRLSWLYLALFIASGPLRAEVAILANSADRDSLNLAAHYAKTRQVPARNIIHLRMPRTEEVTWKQFSTTVLTPLREALMDRGLLSGQFGTGTDAFGRRPFIPLHNKVEYLVLCRGVPLKLKNELGKVPLAQLKKTPKNYRTTTSSVDAELALLASENQPVHGWVHNPLFNQSNPGPFTRKLVVKVSRLDGPSQEAALRLVDSAVAGEKAVHGRAYIDSGGPHAQGNDWMDAMAGRLREEGFPMELETSTGLFRAGQRFDAPLLYFGWHSYKTQGPFARTDLKFPPGALAFHIHSFSAQSLRTDIHHWVGPLVQRGVAGTVGNVSEPYLHLTHHLPVLLEQLLSGKCLADAAYASLPALSWQAVLVGDPLYKPALSQPEFSLPEGGRSPAPFHLEQYSVIRWMRKKVASGNTAAAISGGRSYIQRAYGLPLALELARYELQQGRTDAAGNLLAPAAKAFPSGFQDAGVLLEAAKLLNRIGYAKEADQVLANVKRLRNLPASMKEQLR